MSDQGYDPQHPNAPVPPPLPPDAAPGAFPEQPATAPQPQQPPAQQPPAQQPPGGPVYGAAPVQPPVKKKSRTGLVVGIIIAILLCGLVSCGVIGVSLFKSGSTSKTASIAQAETHFNAAMGAVQKADVALKGLGSGTSSTKVTAVVKQTNDALRAARDEIASAKAIADQWSESQGKTDYLAGLAAATQTMGSMEDLIAYVNTASGMLAKSTSAGKKASSGMDDLNAAIQAGNRSKYSLMRSKALSASTHFTEAALLFRDADKLDPSAGLSKAALYCDARKKQADVVVRMAAEGQAHRYSAYNGDIKKMNAAGNAADKVGTPAIVSDPQWAQKRLATVQKSITDASQKADNLHVKALQELGYSK